MKHEEHHLEMLLSSYSPRSNGGRSKAMDECKNGGGCVVLITKKGGKRAVEAA